MATWVESTYLELQSQCPSRKVKNINIKYEDIYNSIIKIGEGTNSKSKTEPPKRLLTKALNELKIKYGLIDFDDPKDGFVVKNKKQKFDAAEKDKPDTPKKYTKKKKEIEFFIKNSSQEDEIKIETPVDEQYLKIFKSKKSYIYILKAIIDSTTPFGSIWPELYYIGWSKDKNIFEAQQNNGPFEMKIYFVKEIADKECINIYKYMDRMIECSLKNRWVNSVELCNIEEYIALIRI